MLLGISHLFGCDGTGQIVLPLGMAINVSVPVPFDEIVTRNGQAAGRLSGEIQVWLCVGLALID